MARCSFAGVILKGAPPWRPLARAEVAVVVDQHAQTPGGEVLGIVVEQVFLDRGEADVRMLLQEARQGRRSAARSTDDEGETRLVVQGIEPLIIAKVNSP